MSIWIGNRTVATAHFDMTHNLACCMVGRRRFSLFPPEQVHNLYPGPLEPTPGGQVISMVNFDAPDFERFPRFREALAAGQVAEIEPGDVLFYPAMWWHHVQALESFNTMINYWWTTTPAIHRFAADHAAACAAQPARPAAAGKIRVAGTVRLLRVRSARARGRTSARALRAAIWRRWMT